MEKADFTTDEAVNFLVEERKQRVRACTSAIQSVLQQHGCEIRAMPVITQDGRIVTEVKIVAV